jgi:hypothetical protein
MIFLALDDGLQRLIRDCRVKYIERKDVGGKLATVFIEVICTYCVGK